MNVLIIGNGARESAFAWKIKQSPLCTQLFIANGNAGTSQYGQNISLDANNHAAIVDFISTNDIHTVLIGPEAPLVDGLVDYLLKVFPKGVNIIGPSKVGALLEGSKDFAKEFMLENNIPTASYRTFQHHQLKEGLEYIDAHKLPIVLKADGLAAGKGVVICENKEDAKAEFREMLDGKFGDASKKIVVEQFLKGIEFSVFVITDGTEYQILPMAKDYKRVGEGDTGANTGGMGAVSPVPFVDEQLMNKVEQKIIIPTIEGLKSRNIAYKGFIFFGLIKVDDEPFVIEYNCRMGDPETEVVIPRLNNDLLELFSSLNEGRLKDCIIDESSMAAVTIVLASGGYPNDFQKGFAITGLDAATDKQIIFHASTQLRDDAIVTNGGRVLALTSLAPSIKEALEKSNSLAKKVSFKNMYYRSDIGLDLLS
ncbi:MAG: phosphoribosylamine--glycine ligase [Saprospiraceae bacterium]|nr:phosphoribosylamine--glycine ligase [Saprospiraceae bacterium]